MKRFLLALPVVVLLAAGCNSSTQVSSSQVPVPSPVVQAVTPTSTVTSTPTPGNTAQLTPTPKPSPKVVQNSTPTPTQATTPTPGFQTVTNDTLHFSVGIPQGDSLAVDAQIIEPVFYRYAVETLTNEELSMPINIEMQSGSTPDLVQDLPSFITPGYDLTNLTQPFTKPFTTAAGLTGVIFDDPNNVNPDPLVASDPYLKEAVVIPYPSGLQQEVQPVNSPQVPYPLLEISMDGTTTPFTAAQQALFMEVVNSFQFTH